MKSACLFTIYETGICKKGEFKNVLKGYVLENKIKNFRAIYTLIT